MPLFTHHNRRFLLNAAVVHARLTECTKKKKYGDEKIDSTADERPELCAEQLHWVTHI